MTNEGSDVALGLKVWKAQLDRADKLFGGLSSEVVLREIAPGRNRLLYLWGHLTAMHDAMLPLLGLGDRFHPEFDVAFVSNPDKSQAAIPSHEQRSEEHTSELQSPDHLVCRLLLEKKKKMRTARLSQKVLTDPTMR